MSTNDRRLIDYYQEVLGKISFADRVTFRKELRKAFRQLLPEGRQALKHWFRTTCVCRLRPAEAPAQGRSLAR